VPTPHRYESIVLDFDGTFTRVDEEAAPFVEGFREDLNALIGERVDREWQEAWAHIARDPNSHGWQWGGQIVAPSHADPYIQATSIAQYIFDSRKIFLDLDRRGEALQALYANNYRKAHTIFRDEARSVVEALVATGIPVVVVTNSHTDAVSAKLDTLAPRGRERIEVIGDAKKYVVCDPEPLDDRFSSLEDELYIDDLARPIYLRRGKYFEALSAIWARTGARPETTIVCGDIFELDLAMPNRLGVHIHLVARPSTAAYERQAVHAREDGAVSDDLWAFVERVTRP
jgi:FMN phosphatase YigB (HAD superfamily)